MKHVFIILILFLSGQSSLLAQKYLRYTNYTLSDGLSNNYTDCIFQDSRGFLWIGTWDGLNRFDGYNFRQYKTNPLDSRSIKGNWVFSIFEDSDKNLWFCTNIGLSRYNFRADNFETIRGLDTFAVKYMTQDAKQNLWLSTDKGLYCYNHRQHKILDHLFPKSLNNLQDNDLNELLFDAKQNLWIASANDGLLCYSIHTKHVRRYLFDNKTKGIASNKQHTLMFDKQGRLWIGSFDNGISILDTARQQFEYLQFDKNNPNSIGSNAIGTLLFDSQHRIWVCCQNGYLNQYRSATNNFHRFIHNPYIASCLKTAAINCVYEDKSGNVWVGTHGSGISCLNKTNNLFHLFLALPNTRGAMPENKVTSFVEMPDGNIVIGTDGGGLCVFDRRTENFETYNTQHGLRTNSIIELQKGANSIVWLATWNGGIAQFDYKSRKITSFVNDPLNNKSLIFNNTKGVYPDKDYLWIATHGEGIALFNYKTKQFVSYKNKDTMSIDLKAPTWANSIYKDSKRRYWFSTYNSLYYYDGKRLKSFVNTQTSPIQITSNQVLMVFEDYQHHIWVITNAGVDRYNEPSNTFEHFSNLYHLPQNPKAIIEDNNHRLWISSDKELCCFDYQTKHVKYYTHDDGLPNVNFMYRAAYKLKDGNLLFGSTDGFIQFHPDSLQTNTNTPAVYITNLLIDHKIQLLGDSAQILKQAIQSTDTLVLPYSNSVIGFEFASVDLSNPSALKYAYQLTGLNNTWIALSKDRSISVSNLAPGSYCLHIKAIQPNGLYGTNGKGLVVLVLPPWWRTWWFIALLCVAIGGLLFLLFQYRLRRITQRNKELERIVAVRTADLLQANNELVELNTMKNRLFSIIAHDLRNPMGTLIGFSTLLIESFESSSNEKKLRYIKLISISANNISSQLEQLLHWAIAQSNTAKPRPQDCELSLLLKEVLSLINEMAQEKGISIVSNIACTHHAFVDGAMISTVIRNLVSNAIKFTPQNGSINITIEEQDNWIVMSIVDSGVGMTDEQITGLFNTNIKNSTYGTNNEKGTGLGLSICKDFVEKNNGTLHVESTLGQGSCFRFCLPIGNVIEVATAIVASENVYR